MIKSVSRHILSAVPAELNPYLSGPIDGAMHEMVDPFGTVGSLRGMFRRDYIWLGDLLNQEGLDLMAELAVPENGKCDNDDLLKHQVAGPLVHLMGNISLMNGFNNPLHSDTIKSSLRDETGTDLQLPEHRDLLDGHAVIFNYQVDGKLFYVINGVRVPIENNSLHILHGAAKYIRARDYLNIRELDNVAPNITKRLSYAGATVLHGVVGEGATSRKRLLVYADGLPATVKQLAS